MTAPAARYAGQRIKRIEDPRLLTGHGQYVDDVVLPRMLHAVFVRSPFARANIRGIDTSAASEVPGVLKVFTAADINHHAREQWHTQVGKASPETPRPPLADDIARFVGDPVALVVAADRYVAEDAAELVDVDYEPLEPVVDYETAADNPNLVHEAHGSNLIGEMGALPLELLADDFAAAAHVTRMTIRQQAYSAVPMEPRGILCDYSPITGDYTIYAATQTPHEWRAMCARLLGMDEHKIRVIMKDTGGGFGQKVVVQRDDMVMMIAGRLLGRPVKWFEDRRENLIAAGKSRHEMADVAVGFDADGAIAVQTIDFRSDCGAYPTPWPVGTAAVVGFFFPGPYKVKKASFRSRALYTNTAGRTPYRGPWQFESLAREVMLEQAARELGVDPVEVRRKNLLSQADLPYTTAIGMPIDKITPLECFENALEIVGYSEFRAEQARLREQGRYIGIGMSNYFEPTTTSMGYFATESATIRIEPTGQVNVYIAGGSAGNSLETTVVQLAADALGVDIEDVHTIQGDTALTGFGGGTAGSRSGSMTAGAVEAAAAQLRERIAQIAAHKLEASPADIEIVGGSARVKGVPGAAVALKDIADTAYFDSAKLPPGVEAGLEVTARYATKAGIMVNATHCCTCEVDPVTGHVTLLRYIVSEDCGPMINPDVVEGQISGGVVQGIGGALLEEAAYDADGNPLATTFLDYLLPTSTEVPVIEFGHVETMSDGPGGYKGVGEGGAIGSPPAVVNAVADALAPFNVVVDTLPLSPARIVALIEGSQQA